MTPTARPRLARAPVHPNRLPLQAWAERAAPLGIPPIKAQLPANDGSVVVVPAVVAHGPHQPVVVDLHPVRPAAAVHAPRAVEGLGKRAPVRRRNAGLHEDMFCAR